MQISYRNKKVSQQCTKLGKAKQDFPSKVALKLHRLVNFLESAETLKDVISFKSYNFHDLKGDKLGQYAFDIDGRASSYRLIVSFEGISKETIFSDASSIQLIEIEEVSKHYE